MVTVFKILKEDNEQILEMIRQLDQKILKLKKDNQLPPEYLEALTEFYQEATLPWMDRYYLLDREADPDIEQDIVDKIYNLFLLLQVLEQ
jgi:hypothetical protein